MTKEERHGGDQSIVLLHVALVWEADLSVLEHCKVKGKAIP
jgi:hypothetical protein